MPHMDLNIILDGWPYDEENEANNVRKVMGLDRRLKLQVRLRDGVIQWEVEGAPLGGRPYGHESVLSYCRELAAATPGEFRPAEELLGELEEELWDYTRRRRAFLLFGDYAHAAQDAAHAIAILDFVRQHVHDVALVLRFDRCRPAAIADRARAEALQSIREGKLNGALQALSRGIEEIEAFFAHHGLSNQAQKSRERRALVDLRRSLRERYNVPLTDAELLHALLDEQRLAIEQEDYEMAARLRDKISSLRRRTQGSQ